MHYQLNVILWLNYVTHILQIVQIATMFSHGVFMVDNYLGMMASHQFSKVVQ